MFASILKTRFAIKFLIFSLVGLLNNCWANPFFIDYSECLANIHNFRCPNQSDRNFFFASLVQLANSGTDNSSNSTFTVSNLKNQSLVQTGFLVGTASANTSKLFVSLDGGSSSSVTISNGTWSYQLPAPVTGSHWRLHTNHTITLQSLSESGTLSDSLTFSVKKGINHDTNGDGYPDLIVANTAGNTSLGYGMVVFGNGSTGRFASSPNSSVTDGLNGGSSNFLGSSIGAGDFNGDGYADLIIGAQKYNGGSTIGEAFIFHSSGPNGILNQDLSAGGSYNTLITGTAGGERVGAFVMGGDVNDDGYDDAILSSPWTNNNVSILYSKGTAGVASGLITTRDLHYFPVSSIDFGFHTAIGDINGDSYTDLVTGATFANALKGQVQIYFSTSGALPTSLSVAQQILDPPVACGNCNFGNVVALADFNGDGCDDLVGAASVFNSSQGLTYIYHSNCSSSTPFSAVPTTTLIGPSQVTCASGTTCYFGSSLAVGDVNADGYADLLVGASSAANNYGAAYLFTSSGSGGISNVDLSSGGIASSTITGNTTDVNLGRFVSLTDFNADAKSDVIVSSAVGSGALYAFQSTGSSGSGDQNLGSGAIPTTTITSTSLGTSLGNSIARNILERKIQFTEMIASVYPKFKYVYY